MNDQQKKRRFRVAFSFSGENKRYVKKIADIISSIFHEKSVLFYDYHKAELSQPDAQTYLTDLYTKESELIVVVFSESYNNKVWTSLEWTKIKELIDTDANRIMLCRLKKATADGLNEKSIYFDLDQQSPFKVAYEILKRLAIIEGFEPDHYSRLVKKSQSLRIVFSSILFATAFLGAVSFIYKKLDTSPQMVINPLIVEKCPGIQKFKDTIFVKCYWEKRETAYNLLPNTKIERKCLLKEIAKIKDELNLFDKNKRDYSRFEVERPVFFPITNSVVKKRILVHISIVNTIEYKQFIKRPDVETL
jgi:hypothetical protein